MQIDELPRKALPSFYILKLIQEIVTLLVCGTWEHLRVQINKPMQIRSRHCRQSVVIEVDMDYALDRDARRKKLTHAQIGKKYVLPVLRIPLTIVALLRTSGNRPALATTSDGTPSA